jgi:hypothetical protein
MRVQGDEARTRQWLPMRALRSVSSICSFSVV